MAPRVRDVVVAVVGGIAVLVLLRPSSGQDSMPPKCWNALGGEVDCEAPYWPHVFLVAGMLFVLMWLISQKQARRRRRAP